MKVHDVSLALAADLPVWPGKEALAPEIKPLRRIANGDSANVSLLSFANHTGTHVDPPLHFIEGGNTVDRLPLDALVGPCTVVAYGGDAHISGEWLDRAGIPDGTTRLLFKTRNSERWREPIRPFDERFVALDDTAARWCVHRGVRLVGVDYLSVEPFGSGPRGHPTHMTLLGADIVVIEGVALADIEPGAYELFCGPLKVKGGDGAPARVFLIER